MNLNLFAIFLIFLCFGSWLVVSKFFFQEYFVEIFLGMFAPLIFGLISVFKIKSIFLNSPLMLTSFMIKSFVFKMIAYGIYFVGLVTFSTFNPPQFFISFIFYFGALHVLEALFISSVFKGSKAQNESSSGN